MPLDDFGNRAELIFAGETTLGRMNAGRLYEQYINYASSWVTRNVITQVENKTPQPEVWRYLNGYYSYAAPIMHEIINETLVTDNRIKNHIDAVIKDGIYLYAAPHNPTQGIGQVRDIHQHYPPPISPVTYRGQNGVMCRTKLPVIIGSMYFLLLEKTGHDWAASPSPKRQHFGCISVLTAGDRNSSPGREQATRVLGESEVRAFNAFVGAHVTADLMDTANNPAVHKSIVKTIYRAEVPTDIPEVLDRSQFPIGQGRSLQLAKHIAECSGYRYKRAEVASCLE